MKHKIISKIAESHPYEVVKAELQVDKTEKNKWIMDMTDQAENYLTMTLQVVEIIEQNSPFFVIKKVKSNIGFRK